MKTITASSLRNRMKYFLDLVSDSCETLMIPRNNEDDAVVLMPLSEYNSLLETNYLTATEKNRKRLEDSILEVEKGQTKKVNI
ncbi:type II toxin-antitoxin system Phd/YefM family antitoxin [Bizionia paragorgiae]|uniref:type II toxin-antitoxin system Phd/YefM family antitoxin n=1 Tax=Bizionia paragorgiae TaxID=283786 RepID=UPI003A9363B1